MLPLRTNRRYVITALFCAMVALSLSAPANAADSPSSGSVLKAPDVANLMPATVFFRGQSASVQMRNTAGVKLSDGMFVLCGLVDTSGYSSTVQQKYQAYFITEVAVDIEGQILKPGAYGVGFVEGNRFLVMDLGAHDLFTAGSTRDTELKRPVPLQILADSTPNGYRFYVNRNYIVFSRAPGQ